MSSQRSNLEKMVRNGDVTQESVELNAPDAALVTANDTGPIASPEPGDLSQQQKARTKWTSDECFVLYDILVPNLAMYRNFTDMGRGRERRGASRNEMTPRQQVLLMIVEALKHVSPKDDPKDSTQVHSRIAFDERKIRRKYMNEMAADRGLATSHMRDTPAYLQEFERVHRDELARHVGEVPDAEEVQVQRSESRESSALNKSIIKTELDSDDHVTETTNSEEPLTDGTDDNRDQEDQDYVPPRSKKRRTMTALRTNANSSFPKPPPSPVEEALRMFSAKATATVIAENAPEPEREREEDTNANGDLGQLDNALSSNDFLGSLLLGDNSMISQSNPTPTPTYAETLAEQAEMFKARRNVVRAQLDYERERRQLLELQTENLRSEMRLSELLAQHQRGRDPSQAGIFRRFE